MPTYDYECRECGHEFEEFQSMTAGALRKCPSCGKLKLRRLIGAGAGIIFKGSGFYETDYKRRATPGRAGTERETSSSETSDSSSSDNGKASDGGTAKAGSSNGKAGKSDKKTGSKKKD